MTRKCLWIFLFFSWINLQGNMESLNEDAFRWVAEFEKQEAIWVSWSSDAVKTGHPYASVQTEIVRQLAPYIQVKVVVKDEGELNKAKLAIEPSVLNQNRISYFVIPNDTIFLRDIGPNFLRNNAGELECISFNFNNWGHLQFEDLNSFNFENHKLNKEFNRSVAALIGAHAIVTEVISEGGNRDHNGQGIMLVVEAVESQRNPHLTEQQLFEEYERVLGIKKVIRLKQGMCQDEVIEKGPIPGPEGMRKAYTLLGNGGHIDGFCRFIGPHTILLAEVDSQDAANDPIAFENQRRLEENFKILEQATDLDGNAFIIIRMPATDSLYIDLTPEDGFYEYLLELNFPVCTAFPLGKFPRQEKMSFLLPTSYLNFVIANEVILMPKFWREGEPISIKLKDEKAFNILKSLFPNKKVIAIDILNVNICGGGIHCLTQHEPGPVRWQL